MVIGIDASRANQSEKTGTEWYSWHLIRDLAVRLKDHQLRLYVREPLEPGLQNLGAKVEARVLTWRPGLLWSHLRLSWELLWHRPDVLFVPADTVPLIHPERTVTTIHDVAFERFPELYAGRSVQRRLGWLRPIIHLFVRIATFGRYSASERDYHRWSVRHALRACAKILTVSEFTKREMVDTLGADPKKIAVTYQGVPQPEVFQGISPDQQAATRQKFNLAHPFWLYIGRLEKKKHIAELIAAYFAYRDQSESPADLVLVGSPGYGWAEIEKRLGKKLVENGVRLLGYQPEDVVNVLRVSALGFIFLSAYEGFGRPPLESVNAGVPVIASSKGSLPEVLGDGAIFVDPENSSTVVAAMLRLETDTQLRQKLVERGRVAAKRFTWGRTADLTTAALTDWPGLR